MTITSEAGSDLAQDAVDDVTREDPHRDYEASAVPGTPQRLSFPVHASRTGRTNERRRARVGCSLRGNASVRATGNAAAASTCVEGNDQRDEHGQVLLAIVLHDHCQC